MLSWSGSTSHLAALLLAAPAQTLRYRHIASDITALPHYDGDRGRSNQPSSRERRTAPPTHSRQPPRRLGGESLPSGPAETTARSVGKRGRGPGRRQGPTPLGKRQPKLSAQCQQPRRESKPGTQGPVCNCGRLGRILPLGRIPRCDRLAVSPLLHCVL